MNTAIFLNDATESEPVVQKPILELTPIQSAIMRLDNYVVNNLTERSLVSSSEVIDFLLDIRNDIAKLK